MTEVLGEGWYVESARWVPGGDGIVAAAAKDSTLTIPSLSLWLVDPGSGDAKLRTPALEGHVGFRLNHDMPARELSAHDGLVVPDRAAAFVTVQKRGCAEIWRVGLQGSIDVTPIVRGERACIVLDANRRRDALLYATTDLQTPFELALASLEGRHEKPLTQLNAAVLDRWQRTRVEPFSFMSADGLRIDAWFMSLAHRKGPVPTVLFIHAGPYLATGHAFRFDFHPLASQGYGVLFANFRGSAGYGESFVRAIAGDWGARAYPDHMGAVDAAIEHGYADQLVGRFDMANIKLDKCGGLTHGLAMARALRDLGLEVMVGCMGGTSLAMAPAYVLGQLCDVVDLDGAAMLKADRAEPAQYTDGLIACPEALWGAPS